MGIRTWQLVTCLLVLYEWGGHDEVGEWRFGEFRPGWEQPVHALLRETGVSAVFHGHDHFFAPNSGHVRVDVSKEKAVISYVRSANEDLKKPRFENGDVAYEYLIVPASSPAPGSTTR